MILGIPRPIVLAIAPSSSGHIRTDYGLMPLSQPQLEQVALDCHGAGASILVVSLQDEGGKYCVDPAPKAKLIETVRSQTDGQMLVQLDLTAPLGADLAERLALISSVAPDICQIALCDLLPRDGDEDDEDRAKAFLTLCEEKAISVQLAMRQPSDLDWYYAFRQYGVIPDHCRSLLFCLGAGEDGVVGQGGKAHDIRAYLAMLDKLNLLDKVTWSVACHGPAEPMALVAAMALGGHIQTGFAYNHHTIEGDQAPSNTYQVAAMVEIADKLARPPASSREVKTLMT